MKAIQTTYNGYKFRSRLEARWAVFFDVMGIEYQYEPEGFEAFGYKYLPDFYLPKLGVWAEVKGGDMSVSDANKMAWLVDYCSPIPGVQDSEHLRVGSCEISGGILLLGDIPNPYQRVIAHNMLTHAKGIYSPKFFFTKFGISSVDDDYDNKGSFSAGVISQEIVNEYFNLTPSETSLTRCDEAVFRGIDDLVRTAYTFARQARFEHGETPCFR